MSSVNPRIQSTHQPSPPSLPPFLPSYAPKDPKELFDLFEPPTPEEIAGAKVEKIRPSGQKKIRSLVHAEGDWHR